MTAIVALAGASALIAPAQRVDHVLEAASASDDAQPTHTHALAEPTQREIQSRCDPLTPDREHASRRQLLVGRSQQRTGIEGRVPLVDQKVWAVVNVEEDGVPRPDRVRWS